MAIWTRGLVILAAGTALVITAALLRPRPAATTPPAPAVPARGALPGHGRDPPEQPHPVRGGTPGPLNVLLLGVDEGGARTDVIMVVHWEPARGLVNLISLPRDSLVEIPCPPDIGTCVTPDKLGHAHAYGSIRGQGPELARATVEQLLGIRISHWIRADFIGFTGAVDALGGVTVDVEPGMEGIGLPPGPRRLDGEAALRYVRWRGDGMGDIGRIHRTHRFMAALLDTARRPENRSRLPALALATLGRVQTSIDPATALTLVRVWLRSDVSDLQTAVLPGEPRWERGLWYWATDEAGKQAMVDRYLSGAPAELP